MAIKVLLRKNPTWVIICCCPDVCKTPVGSVPTPVPYPVISRLSPVGKEVKRVKVNGKKAFNSESFAKMTIGDQPGILKGLKSQKTGGRCFAKQKSSSLSIGKHKAIRSGDIFEMNANARFGNTIGFVTQFVPTFPLPDLPDKPEPVWPDVLESVADIVSEIASAMMDASASDASRMAAQNAPFAKTKI